MKIRFSVPIEKRIVTIPWATWASPTPTAETATPNVLFTQSEFAVTLTYSAPGAEDGEGWRSAGPQHHTIQALSRRLSGASLGTISRSVDFQDPQPRLFAGRVRSTKKVARVKTLTIRATVPSPSPRIGVGPPVAADRGVLHSFVPASGQTAQ